MPVASRWPTRDTSCDGSRSRSHNVNVSRHPRKVAARSARSLSRHVQPPLGPAAPISHHAPLARPAALHRRGHALIAAVQAAATRGQKTAFALPVVGKPVASIVCNHRAPRRGQVGLIYATGPGSARRVAGAEVSRARASPAAARAARHHNQGPPQHTAPRLTPRASALRIGYTQSGRRDLNSTAPMRGRCLSALTITKGPHWQASKDMERQTLRQTFFRAKIGTLRFARSV
jgi:hypothetical protein